MIIDAHQHLWKYSPEAHSWISDDMGVLKKNFLPEDLELIIKTRNIVGTIAVQAEHTEHETEFLLSLAKQHHFIKGIVGWVDLRASNLEEKLKRYSEEKLVKGFRHIIQAEPSGFLSDQKFIDGVNKLADNNFTYDLLIYHHQLDEALKFANETQRVN